MCDFAAGQLIVMRPSGDGAAASAAARALAPVMERYSSGTPLQQLDNLMTQSAPPAWEGSGSPHPPKLAPWTTKRPFYVDLYSVPKGEELSIAEEIRSTYFDTVAGDEKAIRDVAGHRFLRLHVSPNWNLHPAAGSPDVVTSPFLLTNHVIFLQQVGLHNAIPGEASGIMVAVLDNGFDPGFWYGATSLAAVAAGQDLIPGDGSTKGHGTLVAALIAASAAGAKVVPIRMAGSDSTEWDALHALDKAVAIGAHVITFSYRQILGADVPCATCGLVRTASRSEVFATMVDWASDNGNRAILAAAGNDSAPTIARPAAYKGATAIAALDSSGKALWSKSNWDIAKRLSVLALPGEKVAADASGGASYSGTSFATAYAAALYAVGMARYGANASAVSAAIANRRPMVSNATIPYL